MLQKATFSLKVGAKVIFFCDIYKFFLKKYKKVHTKELHNPSSLLFFVPLQHDKSRSYTY